MSYRHGTRMWAVAVSVYALALFHRSSLGVTGLAAADRFSITAAELSTFAVLQLAVYGALQIPVGALADAHGPRRLLVIGVTVMSAAQLGFALTDEYVGAVVARLALGAGDALVFVSVLRIVAAWFPDGRAARFTTLTALVGQFGAVAAAIPLLRSLDRFGWTATFGAAAAFGLVALPAVATLLRDSPTGERTGPAQLASRHLLAAVWRDPGTQLGLWTHFAAFPALQVFVMLWGFPYLTESEHVSDATAATILTTTIVSLAVVGPVITAYIGRNPWRRSTAVLCVVGSIAGTWALTLAWPGDAPLWLLVTLAIVTGAGGPTSLIGFDVVRTFSPPGRIGLAIGIVNLGGYVGALVSVLAIGLLLDLLSPGDSARHTPGAYRWAMSFQFVIWALGALQVWRYRHRARAHLFATQPDVARRLSGMDAYAPRTRPSGGLDRGGRRS